MEKEFKSESRLSFTEATSIIVGHGVGAGILSVPYLASRNTWWDFLWIIAVAYLINLLMHLMIAELSWNNGGAQFITCLENELFTGKMKKQLTWFAFGLLGLSEIVKVGGFIVGASAVFEVWFSWPAWVGMVVYYILTGLVVLAGMKIVGVCEKISVYAMVGVVAILLVATLLAGTNPLPSHHIANANVMALYSMVAFALSAVMSVPQVVKGLNGDIKKIRRSIALGTGVNLSLVVLITLMTLLGAGASITNKGALVDLSLRLGGWVSVVGYVFTLLALSTSLWACTLNLRDIAHEKTGLGVRICWLIISLPCLLIGLTGASSFVGLTRLSSAVAVLAGLAVIFAYNRSRRRVEKVSPIVNRFSPLPYQILVIVSSLLATVGSLVSVK